MERSEKDDLEIQLCRYLDGELSRREKADLERRLADDEQLRMELRRYADLDGYLAAIGEEELEDVDYDSQRAEILAAVEHKALLDRQRRQPLILRPVFGALAAAAVLLVAIGVGVVMYWPGGGGSGPPIGPIGAVGPAAASAVVRVLPLAPAGRGAAHVSVRLGPPPTPIARPVAALAGGTVVVSVGGPAPGPRNELPGEEAMLYY